MIPFILLRSLICDWFSDRNMDTGSVRSRIWISFPEVSKSSSVDTGVSIGVASFEINGVWDMVITYNDKVINRRG